MVNTDLGPVICRPVTLQLQQWPRVSASLQHSAARRMIYQGSSPAAPPKLLTSHLTLANRRESVNARQVPSSSSKSSFVNLGGHAPLRSGSIL